MAEFSVKPKLKPRSRTHSRSAESKYWGASYKTHKVSNLISSIPSITFSPIASASLFVAPNSLNLTLFSSQTYTPTSSILFSDVVSCCSFRSDGLLLAASDLSGLIQVFDVKTRTALRSLKSHVRPVRFVGYPALDKLHLVSGGDDTVVKYWDVAEEKVLVDLIGHRDYVRCGDGSPASGDVFVTGSYDHTAKLWDARVDNKEAAMMVNHGQPVEDVVFLPSGGGMMVATAGRNSVKIWDLIGGRKLFWSFEGHNKTVTSLCVAKMETEPRILSVGLDGYMKVIDYLKMKLTCSIRFPAPLMSIAVSPDGSCRAIGTCNGMIFGGQRKKKKNKLMMNDSSVMLKEEDTMAIAMRKKMSRPRYFSRNESSNRAGEGETVVARRKKVKKVREEDKLLNKFMHMEAFLVALRSKNPENVVAVMEELVARRKLLKCVSNLGEEELELLLGFLHRYATMPKFASFLVRLALKVVELQAERIRGSQACRVLAWNLKQLVSEEIGIQHSLLEIQGIISPILRIASRR